MPNNKKHIFKFKWWLPLILFILSVPWYCAIITATETRKIKLPDSVLLIGLAVSALFGWLWMMWLSWKPLDNLPKTWQTFNNEFKFGKRFELLLMILMVVFAWLGVGICLIMLPHWFNESLSGIAGGLLQFAGICWIIVWLIAIIGLKK